MAMAARTNSSPKALAKEQPTPARHSRFIPEAERGWKVALDDRERASSAAGSSGSTYNNGSNGNGSAFRRSSSFLAFASLWQSPRGRRKSLSPGYDDEVIEDDAEEMEEEEEETVRGHGRERSNSMPTSPTSEDSQSYFTPGAELERNLSGTSSIKRKSLQLPPNFQLLTSEHEEISTPVSPSELARHNTKSPSISEQRSGPSSRYESRGYAWRRERNDEEKTSYIHPSHRNPTGKQAFYDTHFGSSSGWRSVAGMADDVFHPFGQAKQTLGRWSGIKREKRGKEEEGEPSKTFLERKKESLLSWNALNSLGIFGISSSETEGSAAEAPPKHQTYEPELIPTIHRDPHAHRYFKKLQGNVVIMGGYRGSILRDAETHQMMWVPLKVGVGLRRPTLELGLTSEAEDRSEKLVVADEMLGAIGSMVDMGKRLISRCSTKRTKVYSWGYDWRLSLGRSSKRLEEFLLDLWMQSAEREQDRRGAKVIAHSMGGLVALHALARTDRPEIFDGLVFASTPFLGTANILGPFRFGDAALFNDEICSPRATFSFRSSFYLLPVDPGSEEGRSKGTQGGRCFEEEDGEPHDFDYLDPETWDDLGFSPCVERGRRKEVLRKSRKRAEKEGVSLGEQLNRSASKRETQGLALEEGRGRAAADRLAFPGPDLQLVPSQGDTSPASRQEAGLSDLASDGLFGAAKAGQSALASNLAEPKDGEMLQPENSQSDDTNTLRRQGSTMSDEEWQALIEDEASAAWIYLEQTLAETRRFFHELRTGFRQDYFEQGRYPPLAIMTSGRTPTVRGALVAQTGKAKQGIDDWKQGVREGDYSRMLYAPGDGVILRRSSTTMPGRWAELLVRGREDDKEALTSPEGVVETSHRHVTLLSDVDGIGRCLEACRRAGRVSSG